MAVAGLLSTVKSNVWNGVNVFLLFHLIYTHC